MSATSEAVTELAGASVGHRRHRWGWYLFDFANSILIINGGLYFPQWIVVDNGVSDLWFNLTVALSSIALLLTAPLLGIVSDRGRGRLVFLRYTSVAMFLAGLVIGLGGRVIEDRTVRVTCSLVSFFVIMYCYQLSLVFYNVLLGSVSRPERYARISGRGLAWGWVGGIVGIFFILPFVSGNIPMFQPAGRIQAILPSTLLFGLLTAISLKLIREGDGSTSTPEAKAPRISWRDLVVELRGLTRQRNIWFFLLAYFLFCDAILTIQNNCTIYMEVVFRFSDNVKAYQFLLVLMAGGIGALLSGHAAERFGLKKTLASTLCGWVVVVLLAGLTTNAIAFTVFFGLLGLLNGSIWNVSRVSFFCLVPPSQRGKFFGIYSSYERFASILGPLIWSAPIVLLPSMGAVRYQIAWLIMAPFLAISLLLLRKVELPRTDGGHADAENVP